MVGEGRWVEIMKIENFPPQFNNHNIRWKWQNLKKYNHVQKEGSKWQLKDELQD